MQKNWNYILIGIVVAVITVFAPIIYVAPFLIALLGVFFGLFLISCSQEDAQDYYFLLSLFIAAFLLRIIMASLVYNFLFVLNGHGLLHDSWPYSENGYTILQMWLNGTHDIRYIDSYMRTTSLSGTLGGYDYWNAIVYFFIGKSPISLIFINCIAGSLAIVFVYAMTKEILNRKAAMLAAMLMCFWPSTFLWSIQNLKEPIVVLLICFLMWIFLQIRKRFRFYLIFLAIAAAFALKELRGFAIVVLMAVFLFSLIITSRFRKEMFLFLILTCGIIIFFHGQDLKSLLPAIGNKEELLEWLYRMRSYRASGGSAFLVNLNFSNIQNFIIFLPLSLLIAWLAPFPWNLGSLSQVSAMPEMALFYLFIPAMFYGIFFILKNRFKEGSLIIPYIFVMSLILALIEGNIGTLFRHRAIMLPFCFIVIAVGIVNYKHKGINPGAEM
ncbi:MAG: glycosyltransferase family 39 protein [Candidatus Omnitrophota bacterium]|nr:glycosyltransferase family 39 protein [Candidatus Omnitrophota bacterium]